MIKGKLKPFSYSGKTKVKGLFPFSVFISFDQIYRVELRSIGSMSAKSTRNWRRQPSSYSWVILFFFSCRNIYILFQGPVNLFLISFYNKMLILLYIYRSIFCKIRSEIQQYLWRVAAAERDG